jgi:putative FmdB family regulatory protein
VPIYEFICQACQAEFEELVSSSSEEVPCPSCKSTAVTRKVSMFAFKSAGGRFVSAQKGGSSCSGCTPGPGGCSHCH